MNQEKLLELIQIVSGFYIVPRVHELFNFYPNHLQFSEFQNNLKVYSSAGQIRMTEDFVCLNTEQSIEELIAKRKTTEKRVRIISKYLRHQKLEKMGIQGLFVSIHNFEPTLIIITRNENSDYIQKQMPKYLKSYKDIKVKIICGPTDIKLNLNEVIYIINSEPIFSFDKIHEQILGYILYSLGEILPNLPIDKLKGVRLSKSFQVNTVGKPSRKDRLIRIFLK